MFGKKHFREGDMNGDKRSALYIGVIVCSVLLGVSGIIGVVGGFSLLGLTGVWGGGGSLEYFP